MAVKITKRATNDGARYSISGLNYNQLFRIKNALLEEEEKLKRIASELSEQGGKAMSADFEKYAKETHEVYVAANLGCV